MNAKRMELTRCKNFEKTNNRILWTCSRAAGSAEQDPQFAEAPKLDSRSAAHKAGLSIFGPCHLLLVACCITRTGSIAPFPQPQRRERPSSCLAQSITRLGQGHRASAYHLGPADCLPWLRGRGPLDSSRAVVRCLLQVTPAACQSIDGVV